MVMTTYPILYTQDPPEKRNRLTVFFRFFCAIPHFILAFFYGIAFFVTVVIAWFAIVITGRWPAGLYAFAGGFLRFTARVYAYLYLITDTYPPFDGAEHPEYPVQFVIAPAKEKYSRLKTFFRFLLAIPIYIVQYVFSLWLFVVAVAIWFVSVITGRTSGGLMEAMRMPMAFYLRANAYFYLVTEDWPPFDPGPGVAQAGPPAPAVA